MSNVVTHRSILFTSGWVDKITIAFSIMSLNKFIHNFLTFPLLYFDCVFIIDTFDDDRNSDNFTTSNDIKSSNFGNNSTQSLGTLPWCSDDENYESSRLLVRKGVRPWVRGLLLDSGPTTRLLILIDDDDLGYRRRSHLLLSTSLPLSLSLVCFFFREEREERRLEENYKGGHFGLSLVGLVLLFIRRLRVIVFRFIPSHSNLVCPFSNYW